MCRFLGWVSLLAFFFWVVVAVGLPSVGSIGLYGLSDEAGDHVTLILIGVCVLLCVYSMIKGLSVSIAWATASFRSRRWELLNHSFKERLVVCLLGALAMGAILMFVSSLGLLGVIGTSCGAFLPLVTVFLFQRGALGSLALRDGLRVGVGGSNQRERRFMRSSFFALSRVEMWWMAGLIILWVGLAVVVVFLG
ncbi:MAG: hypothetical protein AAF591_12290 [Verrucomicrobiota bacterium]